MLHVIIIKTTQFLLRKHLFFSFASAAYLQRKSLYLSLFDCQNLFTANKLIPLQRTRPGDRGINDAAKSTCSETTRHLPGLCLLGIGGAPYISHKIMAQKPNFHIFDFFLKPPADGASYYARRFPRPRPL